MNFIVRAKLDGYDTESVLHVDAETEEQALGIATSAWAGDVGIEWAEVKPLKDLQPGQFEVLSWE